MTIHSIIQLLIPECFGGIKFWSYKVNKAMKFNRHNEDALLIGCRFGKPIHWQRNMYLTFAAIQWVDKKKWPPHDNTVVVNKMQKVPKQFKNTRGAVQIHSE